MSELSEFELDLTPIPEDLLSAALDNFYEGNDHATICNGCKSEVSVRMHPYGYIPSEGDVVYVAKCPNCGELLYSRD